MRSDLFHGPNFFLPRFVERGIITLHDLSVLRFPEWHPAARLREYAMHFEPSLARAAHIITVSETVRQEVIDLLDVPADRVTTVYNGVSENFIRRTSIGFTRSSPCGACDPASTVCPLPHMSHARSS